MFKSKSCVKRLSGPPMAKVTAPCLLDWPVAGTPSGPEESVQMIDPLTGSESRLDKKLEAGMVDHERRITGFESSQRGQGPIPARVPKAPGRGP